MKKPALVRVGGCSRVSCVVVRDRHQGRPDYRTTTVTEPMQEYLDSWLAAGAH